MAAAISLAGLSWLAGGTARAEDALELKTSVYDSDETTAAAPTPTLEIKPLEEPPPPPKKRVAVPDPYAPLGIRAGGLILYPSITVGGVATTNADHSATNPQSGLGLRLTPVLRFASDWNRNSWEGTASFDLQHYPSSSDLDTHAANIFTRYRLDIRHDTYAQAEAGYVLSQTGPENPEVPENAVGYQTQHTLQGAVTAVHEFGAFEARLRGGANWNTYDNVKLQGGGSENNSDRNNVEPTIAFRATYTDPPVFKPYAQVAYAPRIYEQKYDRNGIQRSSEGYGLSAGLVIADDPIWSGDVALAYKWRDYNDPSLLDDHVLGLDGLLTWSPTDITSIVFAFGTSLTDDFTDGSTSSRNWTARADLTHALRDNVDLLARGGAEIETVEGGDDVTYTADLGLLWKFSPELAWTASYDFTWLDAARSSRNYVEHRVSAGLVLSR
jgi:hypothetical protein